MNSSQDQQRSAPEASGGSQSHSGQGTTTVADAVVSKIAGTAAREVNGVHGFGSGAARTFGAVRERIPGARASSTQGVTVEVGEKQAAIDLVVVIEYGVSAVEVARSIRTNVIGSVERMTGLDVAEVNIDIAEMHLPGDDSGGDERTPTSRVA